MHRLRVTYMVGVMLVAATPDAPGQSPDHFDGVLGARTRLTLVDGSTIEGVLAWVNNQEIRLAGQPGSGRDLVFARSSIARARVRHDSDTYSVVGGVAGGLGAVAYLWHRSRAADEGCGDNACGGVGLDSPGLALLGAAIHVMLGVSAGGMVGWVVAPRWRALDVRPRVALVPSTGPGGNGIMLNFSYALR